MTDLEITKRCAEAMGAGPEVSHGKVAIYEKNEDGSLTQHDYDPLHDDAQAMALVRRFRLSLHTHGQLWCANDKPNFTENTARNADLNRAICECVAKLEAPRGNIEKASAK